MKQKRQPSIDWSRIYALPYNPFLKEDVRLVRKYLQLPEDGISDSKDAWDWLEKHFKQNRPQPVPWFMPKPTPSDDKLWKTEVPLWKGAIYLIYRHGLPLRIRSNIGLYVVTNDENLLTNWRGLNVDFAVNVKAGKLQLSVTVDGIDAWTTAEQWHEIWEHWVKPLKLNLREAIPPNKRAGYGRALQERIKRDAEWYQLSELDGLGPAKALEKWEEQHPDYTEHRKLKMPYDVSTVTKAIANFKVLITSTNP